MKIEQECIRMLGRKGNKKEWRYSTKKCIQDKKNVFKESSKKQRREIELQIKLPTIIYIQWLFCWLFYYICISPFQSVFVLLSSEKDLIIFPQRILTLVATTNSLRHHFGCDHHFQEKKLYLPWFSSKPKMQMENKHKPQKMTELGKEVLWWWYKINLR